MRDPNGLRREAMNLLNDAYEHHDNTGGWCSIDWDPNETTGHHCCYVCNSVQAMLRALMAEG